MQFKIYKAMQKFNFRGELGSLQLWEVKSDDDETVYIAAGQAISNGNHEGLTNYRTTCQNYPTYIGPNTPVDENYFAGLAAQTGIAYQRTISDRDQIMGQLVMPVYSNTRGQKILQGVIELCTLSVKASYVDEFNQLYNLLKDENLTSPVEKTIKVEYGKDYIYKFSLHWTSGIRMNALWEQVKLRNKRVNQRAFQIVDRNNSFPILSDHDLWACIAESSWNDMETIRLMLLKRVA